jgi:predicted small metal-binding protein
MSKVLKCGDVNPECNFEIPGDSEDDVLRKAAEHARKDHHIESIPPDVLSKVKGAIHAEITHHRAKGHEGKPYPAARQAFRPSAATMR